MVTPQELRAVPRDRWNATPAAEVMKPVDAIVQEDVNQLPVLEQGRIRGVISRDQILRLVAARAELSM
jgi:predicted transcriptional regulator